MKALELGEPSQKVRQTRKWMIMPNTQGYRGDTEPKAPGKLPNGEQVGDSQAESARTRENPGVGVLGNGWITGCLGRDRSQSTNCCWASGRLGSRVGEWHRCKHQRSREAACSRPRLIALWWLRAKSLTLSGSEILYPAGENPGAQICSQHPWPPQQGRAEGRHCPQSRDIKHVPPWEGNALSCSSPGSSEGEERGHHADPNSCGLATRNHLGSRGRSLLCGLQAEIDPSSPHS